MKEDAHGHTRLNQEDVKCSTAQGSCAGIALIFLKDKRIEGNGEMTKKRKWAWADQS